MNTIDTILVTSYVGPDLDGLACAVGYAEFLRSQGGAAIAGIMGEAHEEAQYVLERFSLRGPDSMEDTHSFEAVALVDASDLNSFEGRLDPQKVVEVIDHRKVHEADKFPHAKAQIELVGAAATLVAEKFMQQDIPISRESALLLHSAIISNTLNFRASVTTDRDKRAAEWLEVHEPLPAGFWRELFAAKSDLSGEKLAQRMEDDFATFTMGSHQVGIAQLEILGVERLLAERGEEVAKILDRIQREKKLDYVFQNAIELEKPESFLVTSHPKTEALLKKALGLVFVGHMARRAVLMRKQIAPLIREELERQDIQE